MPGLFDLVQCTGSKPINLNKGSIRHDKGFYVVHEAILSDPLKKQKSYCGIEINCGIENNETQHSKRSAEMLYKHLSLAVTVVCLTLFTN